MVRFVAHHALYGKKVRRNGALGASLFPHFRVSELARVVKKK
jgi:hypothetical protein